MQIDKSMAMNKLLVSDYELDLIVKYMKLGLRVAVDGKNRETVLEIVKHLEE
jgi:hypothetical protein